MNRLTVLHEIFLTYPGDTVICMALPNDRNDFFVVGGRHFGILMYKINENMLKV
jgi:hypothetical protein